MFQIISLLCDNSENDWLDVYDGRNATQPKIGNGLCGSAIPTSIVSSENQLFIRFRSDYGGSKSGFKLLVEEIGKCHKLLLQFECKDYISL